MNWGQSPWTIDFQPEPRALPAEVDFAVIGGGFSGLAAAAWLGRIAPGRSVVLLEASGIGSGASGRTGGLALGEAAAGPLEGADDVLEVCQETLTELGAAGSLKLPGAYEIGRRAGRTGSPIVWEDSGTLRVVKEVPGGTVDAGKVIEGLARAASRSGVVLLENTRVEAVEFDTAISLRTSAGDLRASHAVFATNAETAALSGLGQQSRAKFTLAVMTEPLSAATCAAIGLSCEKGFYTVDLPYLWGRPMSGGAMMFGSGLVDVADDADLAALDIEQGVAPGLFATLERRIRGLHPALAGVQFARRWGGPIRFGNDWNLFFDYHPRSRDAIVLNGLGGDGVSFSVYLGRWAAEALLGKREMPVWGKIPAFS